MSQLQCPRAIFQPSWGFFWLSPACRANASQCIPYFSPFAGWLDPMIAHKAIMWNIPLAIAGSKDLNLGQKPGVEVCVTFLWHVKSRSTIDSNPSDQINEWARESGMTLNSWWRPIVAWYNMGWIARWTCCNTIDQFCSRCLGFEVTKQTDALVF